MYDYRILFIRLAELDLERARTTRVRAGRFGEAVRPEQRTRKGRR